MAHGTIGPLRNFKTKRTKKQTTQTPTEDFGKDHLSETRNIQESLVLVELLEDDVHNENNFDPTSPLQQDLMFPLCRWLDEERPGLRLERGKPGPARQEPHPPRRLQARSLRQHVLRRHHCYWRLLLSQG